jgi:CxC2 like cysteine cluster associated with KDZ transposases
MIVDDTPDALDTGIFERTAGSTSKKIFVPQNVEPSVTDKAVAGPANRAPLETRSALWEETAGPANVEPLDDIPPKNKEPKRQYYYLKEFASRVDDLLQALLGQEALPNDGRCIQCAHKPGRWRCKDCTVAPLLCRACMRHDHKNNPLHRVEFWTGNHFRAAALWEVGAFILVPHSNEPHLCPTLTWQLNTLEALQGFKDRADAINSPNDNHEMSGTGIGLNDDEVVAERDTADAMALEEQMNAEQMAFEAAWFTQDLDAQDPNIENDEENEAADADVTNIAQYLPEPDDLIIPDPTLPVQPTRDALNNLYVRVIHSNGVHHIGLVTCSCQGGGQLPVNLMYAGFVPTSFTHVRTLFTTGVLDLFRYSNLELKASAYQFFQLLRRLTSPMAPAEVINFYHELRRLSRTWRWMKKLKWAGIGHKQIDAMEPAMGELSIFCPACPQIGINVARNWLCDPKRCSPS